MQSELCEGREAQTIDATNCDVAFTQMQKRGGLDAPTKL